MVGASRTWRALLGAALPLLGSCPVYVPSNLAYPCGDGGGCPPGTSCGATGYCVAAGGGGTTGGPQTCGVPDAGRACLQPQSQCTMDAQCCVGRCRCNTGGGMVCCSYNVSVGPPEGCGCDADCAPGLACQGGECCIPAGLWTPCQVDADCCGGHCYDGQFCNPPGDGGVANGYACHFGADCRSGTCENGACCIDVPSQQTQAVVCASNADCCTSYQCSDAGLCCKPTGDGCVSNGDCCSGTCNADNCK